jgi:hypothetical protein
MKQKSTELKGKIDKATIKLAKFALGIFKIESHRLCPS